MTPEEAKLATMSAWDGTLPTVVATGGKTYMDTYADIYAQGHDYALWANLCCVASFWLFGVSLILFYIGINKYINRTV